MAHGLRTRARLGALVALLACEEAWDLDVFVMVAPSHPRTSSAFQVFVAFGDDDAGWAVFRVGYACAGEPFETTARFTTAFPGVAGAEAETVEGWTEPLPGGVAPFCGALPVPERVEPAPPPASAREAELVTPASGCGGVVSREATLELDAGS
ncbi:MAG TPA: hypothetical protein VD838_12540 [Anaeromyxobacteraceae bacterium]|nr:hypothetical protein [Anaeromyxobacteraceae bacterium]